MAVKKHKKYRHLNVGTFVRYAVVGLSGTIVDFGMLVLLVEVGGMNPLIANVISVTLAILNNFTWNRVWVFKGVKKKYISKQLVKFFVVSLIGLLINMLLLPMLIKIGIWYVLAKVCIIGIVVFWNFLGNALWTFNQKAET